MTKNKMLKHIEVMGLANELTDEFVYSFFDMGSLMNLDLKIKVLKELKNGKTIDDYPDETLKKVFERFPGNDVNWDI